MLTLDEALWQPGERIGAWDAAADGHEWLGIYAASDAGVRLLAFERTDAEGRKQRTAELEARGVRIGRTDGGEYVWALVDGRDFVAWSSRERLFTANRSYLHAGQDRFPASDVSCVTSWVDAFDLGHRGVSVERTRQPPVVLVRERDPTSSLDPTYNRDNVAIDAAWASSLGRDLAAWLGVKHENQLP